MLFSNCPEHEFYHGDCIVCRHEEVKRQAKLREDRIEKFGKQELHIKLNVIFEMLMNMESKNER